MADSGLPNIEIARRAQRDLRKLAPTDLRRVRGAELVHPEVLDQRQPGRRRTEAMGEVDGLLGQQLEHAVIVGDDQLEHAPRAPRAGWPDLPRQPRLADALSLSHCYLRPPSRFGPDTPSIDRRPAHPGERGAFLHRQQRMARQTRDRFLAVLQLSEEEYPHLPEVAHLILRTTSRGDCLLDRADGLIHRLGTGSPLSTPGEPSRGLRGAAGPGAKSRSRAGYS